MASAIPQQYIEGIVNFFGYDFEVTRDVLIPRPETEIAVEEAIACARRFVGHASIDILDLGTGSGNMSISLTKEIKKSKIMASDISERAIELARKNAYVHGVSDRIEFIVSDLFENICAAFDIIVSNPPYIARDEMASLPPEVLSEPVISLDGGDGGLDVIRVLIAQAARFLKPGGFLVIEIGYNQADAVRHLMNASCGLRLIHIRRDYAGIERVAVAQRNG